MKSGGAGQGNDRGLDRCAINEGLEKSKEMWKEELAKITGGMQLPFGM